MKMTTAVSITKGAITLPKPSKENCNPIETKNIVTKKSLKDLTFLSISILYGELARVTPPMKEPITRDTPGSPKKGSIASKEKKKHVEIAAKVNISSDFAENLKIGFEIVMLNKIPTPINKIVLSEGAKRLLKLASFDDSNVMATIAIIS